jgi:hypothetical protein
MKKSGIHAAVAGQGGRRSRLAVKNANSVRFDPMDGGEGIREFSVITLFFRSS